MKGMPLPFQFQGKGGGGGGVVPCAKKVVDFQDLVKKIKFIQEPVSVLDNINSSPSPPTSTSTLSSSLGCGGGGFAAVSGKLLPENQESCSNVGVFDACGGLPEKCVDFSGGEEKCGEMEDWESVMTESGQEQSILRWIMGDVEDPSMGLNKMLQGGGTAEDGELSGLFGGVDQGYLGFDSNNNPVGQIGNFHLINHKFTDKKIEFFSNPNPPPPPPAEVAPMFSDHNQHNPYPQIPQFDVKPHKNPTFFIQQQHETLIPPQPKRCNSGSIQSNFQMHQNPSKKTSVSDELGHHSQEIIDQLYKAAEMIQTGNNPILAQSILARLNQQLSPIGKPFDRAAFYFKEALQLLIHSIVNNMNPIASPFSLIFKIGAYKSFSEVSPIVQFMNFTSSQALLESLDGYDQIHVVDFDIGFGDQWASFMQELALRRNNNHVPTLKISAFSSPVNDHFELSLTRENLVHFASEMHIRFDFEIVNVDVLASVSWSLPIRVSDNEAIAVNLPISTFSNHQIPLPLVLRYVKNLSPKIVVSLDRGCERTDLPFPNHIIQALQSYSNLLESLDAVNMNGDVLQKIERFLIQPSVEKIITGRFSFLEKTQHWRSQFLSCGFSPMTFSNFTESQALCVIKRTPVGGFHVERRQSSLVLFWQNRELVSASAWRC